MLLQDHKILCTGNFGSRAVFVKTKMVLPRTKTRIAFTVTGHHANDTFGLTNHTHHTYLQLQSAFTH